MKCFMSVDFILGKLSCWFEKAKFIKHTVYAQLTVCRGRLVVPLKENATVFPYSNMFFPQLRRVDMYLSRLSPCT